MEVKSPSSDQVRIKDHDIFKIKLSLSSLTNSVVICPVYATLYTQSPTDDETWNYCKRGVPGLILTHDGGNCRGDIAAVQLCIADPDSGFAIWREPLRQSSNYRSTQKNFHAFNILSENTNCMGGIRFPTDESGCMFLQEVLCAIPKGEPRSLSPTNNKSLRKSLRKLRKDEISSPCMFKHVTASSVSSKHRDRSKSLGRMESKKGKVSKYSGSGSSLDNPDTDPKQATAERRTLTIGKR